MNEPFPDLYAHMAYQHHWSLGEIDALDAVQLLELHESEHGAGYSHHHHEEPV